MSFSPQTVELAQHQALDEHGIRQGLHGDAGHRSTAVQTSFNTF